MVLLRDEHVPRSDGVVLCLTHSRAFQAVLFVAAVSEICRVETGTTNTGKCPKQANVTFLFCHLAKFRQSPTKTFHNTCGLMT